MVLGVTEFFICHLIYMFLKPESLFSLTSFQFLRCPSFFLKMFFGLSGFAVYLSILGFINHSIMGTNPLLSLEQTCGAFTSFQFPPCTTPTLDTPKYPFLFNKSLNECTFLFPGVQFHALFGGFPCPLNNYQAQDPRAET